MGRKPAVNLSLDAELLDRARALDINVSQAIEPKLREIVADLEARGWAEEYGEAIERFNARIAEFGPIGQGFSRYD